MLNRLVSADRVVKLHFHEEGKLGVNRSVRDILMSIRVNGTKLWQCIMMGRQCEWEGFYTNGLGCKKHKERAEDIAGCAGGELKVHCLKRGVCIDSAEYVIRKCFIQMAYREAMDCKVIGGRVV